MSAGRWIPALTVAAVVVSACVTERFQPSSRWFACMEDAGFTVRAGELHYTDAAPGKIVAVDITDPAPSEQTPAMTFASERCIVEVNGGERVTTPVTPLPDGPAGVFAACMRAAGHDVFDVEVLIEDGRLTSLSYSSMDEAPEDIVRRCEAAVER